MQNPMLKNLCLIETDRCVENLERLFKEHQNIFQKTLFITINPYHHFQLNKLGLSVKASNELVNDEDHWISAQQVTQWVDEYEKSNEELKKQNFGETILFESIFYAQFLLGHCLFLFLLLKKAKESFPQLEQSLQISSFVTPHLEGPFLQDKESMQSEIFSFFFKSKIKLPLKIGPSKAKKPSWIKLQTLKLASDLQMWHLKKLQAKLPKSSKQPIMVTHHLALYNWVVEKNPNSPWLIKIATDNLSWKKAFSLIVFPLWQHFFSTNFCSWSKKRFKAKYPYVIDLFPFAFRGRSSAISESILNNNKFKFFLSKDFFPEDSEKYFDLKEKFTNGIIAHCQCLERSFNIFAPFLKSQEFGKKIHFYNIDNTGLSGSIGEASAAYGFDSTLITHGSHPLQKNPILEKEFLRHGRGLFISKHKYTAVQSEMAHEFANAFIKESELLETGPVVFGKISGKITPGIFKEKYFNDKNILLYIHAGTYKPRNSFRFLMYETVDEYIFNIKGLIKNINSINAQSSGKKIKLIIKIRPTSYLDAQKIRSLLPSSNHYVVEERVPFLDLLQDSEGVISFSSTTIEESILNKRPIFLLKRNNFSFLREQNQLIFEPGTSNLLRNL